MQQNVFFHRFVPRDKMTQKCDPVVREECGMTMRTDCTNLCKEDCQDKDKKVCMTVPHQECEEKPVENCQDVPNSKCRKVRKKNHATFELQNRLKLPTPQCARTDLNKRFLPKPMTTTG